MFNLSNLKDFVLRNVDMPKFDMPGIDLSKLEMPDMPSVDMPRFDMPEIDANAEFDRFTGFVRDVAYVGIGAAVVTARAADDRRREIVDQWTEQVRKFADTSA
jgi:hypothetical protein